MPALRNLAIGASIIASLGVGYVGLKDDIECMTADYKLLLENGQYLCFDLEELEEKKESYITTLAETPEEFNLDEARAIADADVEFASDLGKEYVRQVNAGGKINPGHFDLAKKAVGSYYRDKKEKGETEIISINSGEFSNEKMTEEFLKLIK